MRVKVTEIYTMEQLLPIVAQLTNRFVSCESTSVTYERARYLMEAVIYCIHECEGGNQLATNEKLPVKDAYESGYKKLLLKVKQAQTAYSEMIVDFNSFGNENYYDTVTKGISGFFQYYDDRPHGKILIRVVNYVNSVSDMLSNGLINLVLEILNLVFIVIFMWMFLFL